MCIPLLEVLPDVSSRLSGSDMSLLDFVHTYMVVIANTNANKNICFPPRL